MEGSTAFGGLHWNTEDALLRILLALPEAAITDKNPLLPAVNIVLDDRKPEPEDGSDAYKLAWQAFLKSYNLLQFLPRVAWTTSTAIERGTYGPLTWKDPLSPQREDSEEEAVTDPGWDEVLEEVLEEFRPGVEKLLSLGVALPEVGYELQLESGEVVAEAEIAWPENKVAGLSPEQLEFAGCFTHQGWETLSIDEGVAWVEQIHRLLEEME
jgi:DEAD/DEAH box helicase domain-containing protein